MKKFDVKHDERKYSDCYFEIGKYTYGKGLALRLRNEMNELCVPVTANYHFQSDNLQYLDIERADWVEIILWKLGIAERTGKSIRSNYYEYPLMEFNLDRLNEYGKEYMERKNDCSSILQNIKRDFGLTPTDGNDLRNITTGYAARKMHSDKAIRHRADKECQTIDKYGDLLEFITPLKDKNGKLAFLACTYMSKENADLRFRKFCADAKDGDLGITFLDEKYKPLKNGNITCLISEKKLLGSK